MAAGRAPIPSQLAFHQPMLPLATWTYFPCVFVGCRNLVLQKWHSDVTKFLTEEECLGAAGCGVAVLGACV